MKHNLFFLFVLIA
uniref:Uncharacterized protein n=1 Tax=Anguilla anguilla TaxID=7936 RepID=A0A0E9TXI5_ANGAN